MKKRFKRIGIFLLTLVLFITNPPFTTTILAATSWTQSDWSGGSGQGSWSDTTKFSSASQVTTSTANQATITTGIEEFTNTGFETDLTGWTQTAENTAGTFADTNFLTDSSAVAAWPLDDITTTQSYSRVVNPALATGRNIILNGTFDSDTLWAKGIGWDVNVTTPGQAHAATTTESMLYQSPVAPVIIGKAYQATYTISNYSGDGNLTARTAGGTGISKSGNGTYTTAFIATSTIVGLVANGNFTADIDNVSVTQINLPASNSTATQLLTDGDMEASGTTAWTAQNGATLTKQATTPHGGTQTLRIMSTGTSNPLANQTILTVGKTYRVYGYTRSDGTAIPRVQDVGAIAFQGTNSTTWQPFDAIFIATQTQFRLSTSSSVSGQYVEFDDVVVSEDTYIRTGEIKSRWGHGKHYPD